MHKKSVGHLKKLESDKNTIPSISFVDCGEADIKLEAIEDEVTLDEYHLSIKMEADNVEESIKQELGEEIHDKDPLS